MSDTHTYLEQWHKVIKDADPTALGNLLADDVVFHSPVVWTPQKGKFLTTMYLMAAYETLGNDSFQYTREVIDGHNSILEFTTVMDGITVNGVDIITWNDEGKIVEFKVMVRPLKGMQIVHQKMMEMLERMKK